MAIHGTCERCGCETVDYLCLHCLWCVGRAAKYFLAAEFALGNDPKNKTFADRRKAIETLKQIVREVMGE